MNKALPDYYEMLGLTPAATAEEVKKRYRELARRYHPDVNPDPSASQKIKAVNEAYHVLNDPDRRATYDANRILSQPPASRSAGPAKPTDAGRNDAGRTPAPAPRARPAEEARSAGAGSSRPYPAGRAGYNGFGRTAPEDRAGEGPRAAPPPRPQPARRPAERKAPQQPTVNSLLSEAQLAFVNRRYREAEMLCGQALEMDKRNASVYELLGDVYARKGQTESATTAYSYAIQFNPRNYSIHSKLDRIMGRHDSRDMGPTMTRPMPSARSGWAGLSDRRRDLSLSVFSVMLLVAFAGLLVLYHANTGEAMSTTLPWLTQLSPNLLITALLDGIAAGILLAIYGGMRPVSEELVKHDPARAGRAGGPISLVALLGLFALVLFYLSAAVFVGIGLIYNNFSRSLLRAYLTAGALVGLLTYVAADASPRASAWPVAVFVGNIAFPAVLAGWSIGDVLRLRGRRR